MTIEQQISTESLLDLIARINEDAALIEATQVLAPMAAAALERLRLRTQRAGMLATIPEVTQCRSE